MAVLAGYATAITPEDPLAGFELGELEPPAPPAGWVTVEIRAAALNHHDVWALKGFGLGDEQLPMILGCDAAGVDPGGNEVIVHALVGDPEWPGEETDDPRRTILSERHPGTLAERISVPRRNLVPKPASLSFAEAACLPTAYLTAFRMLFTRAALRPGETVLVQGAGGGVATAAIILAAAAGARVWATSRSERKRQLAIRLGADAAFETGARLPGRVDAVIETVGEATWGHSLRSVRSGGRIVVAGSTSGPNPSADLPRLFFREVSVIGSTMGTRAELERLIAFLDTAGARPLIDRTIPLAEVRTGLEAMVAGTLQGKVVLEP
ncbi:MAG TPA: zinc-binding dehydrogenase [Solirubrobacterales bacterium]